MSTPALADPAQTGVPLRRLRPVRVPRALRDLGAVLALGAVEVCLQVANAYDGAAEAVENVLVVVALAGAGVLLRRLDGQDRNGRLLLLAAALWACADIGGVPAGRAPTFQIAYVADPLPALVLAALLLRWPEQELRHRARRFVLAIGVAVPAGRLLDAVTWDDAWTDYRGPSEWLYVGTSRAVHDDLVGPLSHVIAVAAAVAFLGLLAAHWRAHRRLDRLELLPLAAAAGAAALSSGALEVLFVLPDLAPTGLVDHVQRVSVLLVPLSFALVAVAHRAGPHRAAGLVLQVGAGADVTQTLREALDDPDLHLLYLVDGALITADGTPAARPVDRLALPLRDVDGTELAVLVTDPALARHPEVLGVAVAAAALAIANARLRAAALAQLAEVQASRRRLAESGMAARRDLERDLHDGAQQRLLAVSAALSRARLSTGEAAEAALDETRDELRHAMADLRDLARGVHPALLSQGGLAAAVTDLAARSALDVRTDVAGCRWPAAVEATAYFVVCEALNNTAKHAPGSRAVVTIRGCDEGLWVRVSDDGPGGALPDGHGLRGLLDRARAIGGSACIDSPPGAGTTVTVTLPCLAAHPGRSGA